MKKTFETRRYCAKCQKITSHDLEIEGFKRSQKCGHCQSKSPRFDLRKRTWAGV